MTKTLCLIPFLFAGAVLASEAVKLDTGTGILYGTLEIPAGKPPYPVVLIISGSGPTDRDGNSAALKGKNDSLKMLAEGLAAHGIASLRYDKRMIGESKIAGVKEADLRFDDYVNDAGRWGEYLRKDSRFRSLVVAGHSEGSLIGMLAARKLAANGYVSLEGPGKPAGQLILEQLGSKPLPEGLLEKAKGIVTELEAGRTVDPVPPVLAAIFRTTVQPYLISWFRYDPAKEIAKLTMPVLIVQGTTDIQVSVEDAKLLAKANPAAELLIIEGMNHVLKEVPAAMDKQVPSYSDPSLPVAPKLIDEMASFVLSR